LFCSQKLKHYYDVDLFESAMRFRGGQSKFRYAEGFVLWKLCQPRRIQT